MSKKKNHTHRKLKQTIDAQGLKVFFQSWIQALEQKGDLKFEANGEGITVPQQAINSGSFKLKFEQEKGESELELKLNWKELPETLDATETAADETQIARETSNF